MRAGKTFRAILCVVVSRGPVPKRTTNEQRHHCGRPSAVRPSFCAVSGGAFRVPLAARAVSDGTV